MQEIHGREKILSSKQLKKSFQKSKDHYQKTSLFQKYIGIHGEIIKDITNYNIADYSKYFHEPWYSLNWRTLIQPVLKFIRDYVSLT